ncbi:MAG: hypothetical protein QM677_01645 [Microbacterium sp.]
MPASAAVDALLTLFTWISLGAGAVLAIALVVVWALDGTWLAAEAIVDREGGDTIVRWFDADGNVNSAIASPADAAALAGRSEASIWYRYGRNGRMRLTRRPRGLRTLAFATAGMLALGGVCVIAGWVRYFLGG